jgi:hypothetical protein
MIELTTARSPRPIVFLVAAGIFVVWVRDRTSRALASFHGGEEVGAEVVAQLPCHLVGEPPRRLDAAADRGDGRAGGDV